jgi:fatty-acyl-CoA synthase
VKSISTVWGRWRQQADKSPDREAIVHWTAEGPPFRWTWGELFKSTTSYAIKLKDMGIGKGDVCALIIRHHKEFYPVYLAVSTLGALPAVLAYPNPKLHPDKFCQGLKGMASRSGLDWVLTERELEKILRGLVDDRESTIRGILFPLEPRENSLADAADDFSHLVTDTRDPCLLQHSSGTTGLQKAVVLSNQAILEHVRRYGEAIQLRADDKVVSWLPLYHDMGLIAAFYLPLTFGIPLVQIDPFEWVSGPSFLLEAISQEKGTLVWLPNFAYNFMADRIREEDLKSVRLDSVRMLINCSEPVRAASHDKFFLRFSAYGLKRESLAACYAMAETTFAVTQTPPGREASRIAVRRDDLAKGVVTLTGNEQDARICVSSGFPISGCELRILDESERDLPDGRVGEVAIKSVSMFDEYRNYREKTVEVLKGDWYFSGDFGFSHEGEYYIVGRKKDIIIAAGNNLYPEDIEDIVGQLDGVIPGRVVAFGLEDGESGTEQVCIVVETPAEREEEKRALRMGIRKAGMEMGVTISRVYLVPSRWLIKSSAGKPSRNANRTRAISELTWR